MFIDKLFDKTLPGLEKTLDLTWKRNEAIVSNISNADTPKYRAVDLNFATELDRAFGSESTSMRKTNSRHMDLTDSSSAHYIPDLSGPTKPDGNNVDIDVQMGRLAYNSGRYSSAVNVVRKKFALLSTAIRQVA
jgi:flagellar basal-body rod protein FlgB